MEIQHIIEQIEGVQRRLKMVSLAAVEKDILLQKIADLYESLLYAKTSKTTVNSAENNENQPSIKIETKVIIEDKTEKFTEEPKDIISVLQETEAEEDLPETEPEKPMNTPIISVNRAEISKQETPVAAPEETAKNAEKTVHSLLDVKTEKSSLNERFQQNTVGLNDRAQQGDLRKMLDFNRTILFTTELFAKDSAAFSKAIDKLNAAQTLEEAFAYLSNEVIYKYKWTPESQAVKLFEKIVRQKFRLQ